MSDHYDVEAVLAKRAERVRANQERIAELGIDMTRQGIAASGAALLRDRLDAKRQRRAEDAGQFDLGGAA